MQNWCLKETSPPGTPRKRWNKVGFRCIRTQAPGGVMTSKLASEWKDDAKVSRPQKVTDVTASDEVIAKSASDAVGAALCDSQEQPGEQPGAARSSILQQKTRVIIHGWDTVFNEKMTVIHSWNINWVSRRRHRLTPAYDFLKKLTLTHCTMLLVEIVPTHCSKEHTHTDEWSWRRGKFST